MGAGKRSKSSRKGIALLLTLLILTALTLIVAQLQTTTTLAYKQAKANIYTYQCRRILDSAPGLASRILYENGAGMAFDTETDEWCFPKVFEFNLGDDEKPDLATLTIEIEDCNRRYDLKPLLVEDPDLLAKNITKFDEFAVACGLDKAVADRLAHVIADEAALRRTEDAIFINAPPPTTTDQSANSATSSSSAAAVASLQPKTVTLMPYWLNDFLALPQLTKEDTQAIRTAFVEHEDPSGQGAPPTAMQFLDQVTMWRSGLPNVNTASREVLLFESETLKGKEEAVDQILEMRLTKPIKNFSQLTSNVTGLTRQDRQQLRKDLQISSNRFRVKAVATYHDYSSRMTMILERPSVGTFTTLWRQVQP